MGSLYLEDLTEIYDIQLTERDIRIYKFIQLIMILWSFFVIFSIFIPLLF